WDLDRGHSSGRYQFLKIMRNIVLINHELKRFDQTQRPQAATKWVGSHASARYKSTRALPCVIGNGLGHLERGGPAAHVVGADFAFLDDAGDRGFQACG